MELVKRQATDQQKIFAKHMSSQGLVSKTSKELSKLKKQPNFKTDRRLGKIVHKEDIHVASMHMDRMSSPIRERQRKIRMRPHNPLTRMAGIKKAMPSTGEGAEGPGHLHPDSGNTELYRHSEKQLGNFTDLNMESPYNLAVQSWSFALER